MIRAWIQRGPGARLETQFVAVDIASNVFDSIESDAERGSKAKVRESNELISMTGTFGTTGSKRGRLRDIGLYSGIGLYYGEAGGG